MKTTKQDEEIKKLEFRLKKSYWLVIRDIAFREDKSINYVLTEATNQFIKNKGESK